MSVTVDFHSQIASIMEVLANAAVAEICKVVDDGYAVVQLEMTRSHKENEFLRRKIKLLELQISRYRAERVKAEGSAGVRLLNRQSRERLSVPSLQTRTRFLNRSPGFQQTEQKIQLIDLDQDPDQEVVTTTKTESAEQEDDLLIVKVETETATKTVAPDNQEPPDASTSIARDPYTATSAPASSEEDGADWAARRNDVTEVSGSGVIAFVVGRTADTANAHCCPLLMRSDSEPLNTSTPSNALTTSCDDVTGSGRANTAALSKSAPSDMITIDGEECEWLKLTHSDQAPLPMIHCGQELAEHRSVKAASVGESPGTFCGGTLSSINCSQLPFINRCHLPFYRSVTMERPYGCASCTKRFFLESDLQRHTAQHVRGKPYSCSQCNKSFVCQSQLVIHRNVHTGERPFSCAVCNRRFSHPSNLRRHQKIQH